MATAKEIAFDMLEAKRRAAPYQIGFVFYTTPVFFNKLVSCDVFDLYCVDQPPTLFGQRVFVVSTVGHNDCEVLCCV